MCHELFKRSGIAGIAWTAWPDGDGLLSGCAALPLWYSDPAGVDSVASAL